MYTDIMWLYVDFKNNFIMSNQIAIKTGYTSEGYESENFYYEDIKRLSGKRLINYVSTSIGVSGWRIRM